MVGYADEEFFNEELSSSGRLVLSNYYADEEFFNEELRTRQ